MADPVTPTPAVEAPAAPAAAQPPAPAAETKPTLTHEQALEELEKVRKEAAKYRTDNKALKEKLDQTVATPGSQTEMEKLQKQVAKISQDLEETRHTNMQLTLAKTYNLPDKLSDRLRGTTMEEMEADAQLMAETLKTIAAPAAPPPPAAPVVPPTSPMTGPTLTMDQIKLMTPEQVNQNWEAVSAVMAANTKK